MPGFWEIYNGCDSIEASLEKVTNHGHSAVTLKRGYLGIAKESYSATLDDALFEVARWPAQMCANISRATPCVSSRQSRTNSRVFRTPSNLQILRFFAKLVENRVLKMYRTVFCHAQWNIGIADAPIHSFLHATPPIRYFPAPPRGRGVADPFCAIRGRNLTILCEEFGYRSSKGVICHTEVSGARPSYQQITTLKLPCHMSYPFVLEFDGEIYCIPETAAAREVAIYKAERCPDKWKKVGVIVRNLAAIDPTVVFYDGLWWLMCTDKNQNAFLNLFAWYSKHLLGPWRAHTGNPVKTDIHSARPAGTPFIYEGVLYRPAQDCSRTYGGRIVINKVVRLTPEEFEEEPVAIIEPERNSKYSDGIHTLAAAGDMTLVDGKRMILSVGALRDFVMRRIRLLTRASSFEINRNKSENQYWFKR
jgi:hypothetical protein